MARKEGERSATRVLGNDGKDQCDDRCTNPMSRRTKTLPFGAHSIREYLGDVNPNDRALRDGKEENVSHQQPNQKILMIVPEEYCRYSGKRDTGPHTTNSNKVLRPTLSINDIPSKVASKFTIPMRTVCRPPEIELKPAETNMKFE